MPRTNSSKTRRSVILQIQRLHDDGQPLNITAVKRSHPKLIKQVFSVQPFWGWKNALEDAGLSYSAIRIHLEPYVKCPLCDEHMAVLAPHVLWVHEIDMEDFRKSYPTAELVSEERRAQMTARSPTGRGRPRALIPHWEPIWSAEYVLDRVAELHRQGLDIHLAAVAHRDGVARKALRFFGSWDNTLRKVGLDPKQIRKFAPYREWTRQLVVERIRQRHAEGKSMLAKQVRRGGEADAMLATAAHRFFDSWTDAVKAAGLDGNIAKWDRPVRYPTPESVIKEIRRRKRKGLTLSHTGLLQSEDYDSALLQCGEEYFGSWPKAVEAAGIDYMSVQMNRRRKYVTKDEIAKAIRSRRRRKLPLTAKSVRRGPHKDGLLYHAAYTLFGSWCAAVERAGIPWQKVWTNRPRGLAKATD